MQSKIQGASKLQNQSPLSTCIQQRRIILYNIQNNLVNKLESPVLISEDFGYYRNVAPSIFFFLGTGDTIPLHSNKFTFDEAILYKGVELYRKLLTNRVGESNKTFVLSHHRASRSAHGGSNSY